MGCFCDFSYASYVSRLAYIDRRHTYTDDVKASQRQNDEIKIKNENQGLLAIMSRLLLWAAVGGSRAMVWLVSVQTGWRWNGWQLDWTSEIINNESKQFRGD